MWNSTTLLVTGSTGSFGRKFVEIVLREYQLKKLIIFSRGEVKQHEMREAGLDNSRLRYFIGDVRDLSRLRRAMSGVDIVVHAAAMKQVPACEYNPFEAVATNVLGAKNVIEAAIGCGVQKVLALSTDKAVEPVNTYGATKLLAEKLFIQANVLSGEEGTHFSCIRYGNVIGSRGSVIPLFEGQRESGRVTITDERMTRFWLTLEQSVRYSIWCLEQMLGGEIFVPKIPSMRLMDVARAVAPGCKVKVIGIRPGEKLHEVLISSNESGHTLEQEGMYVICPVSVAGWRGVGEGWKALPAGFAFTSDGNNRWLTIEELRELI
jgi:UDP-N-acetylglucosamine 4,6-dehydratase